MVQERIRNVAIIAHINHGKSTLADRLLEATGTVSPREMRAQLLDAMDIERERGITIKLTPVRMAYGEHVLNLIDTPGHVDFSTEVSRSLAAVEGVLLLVDATQGIQAQTVANLALAMAADRVIIPVVNKVDLPAADVEGTRQDLARLAGVPASDVLAVSAKTGDGVASLLAAIVDRIPSPRGAADGPFRALVFDSFFDPYRGVVVYVRVLDGRVARRDSLFLAGQGVCAEALELGTFRPAETPQEALRAGEIGFIATGLRDVAHARVGDTVIARSDRARAHALLLPGYAVPQPMVFAGFYPREGEAFPALREALGKYRLNDASFQYHQESSAALGQGFRCGFLGLLHVSIVRERVAREYGVEAIVTVPSVAYRLRMTDGGAVTVRTPAEFPDPSRIRGAEEQWARVEVIARAADIGGVLAVVAARGGIHRNTASLSADRVLLTAEMPLRAVVVDLHDALKSATSGYASLSYDLLAWRPTEVVKLTILVGGKPVEPLAVIVPAQRAPREGRRIVERLKEVIPRHLFPVPLQAAVGGRIIARETIPALRKDVTAPLYGGDVSRKKKLLEKQKKGKKRLARSGGVAIPPEAFLAVLGQ